MPRYLAVLIITLMLAMVVTRILALRRRGIEAMHFGKIDKTDFLIPPFALLFFYLVLAHAFDLPSPSTPELFHSEAIPWIGVCFCLGGLFLLSWSLLSFGQSFRLGIDAEYPGELITSGVFAFSGTLQAFRTAPHQRHH